MIDLKELERITIGVRDKHGPEYDEMFIESTDAVLALIRVSRAAQNLDRMNSDGDWYWSRELETALNEISE